MALISPLTLGVRHIQVLLLFFLLLLANALRVNMSLAIVVMLDPTATNSEVNREYKIMIPLPFC